MARLRCITNYLTRMRLTNAEGVWSLTLKMHLMRRCQQAFSRGLSLIVRLQNPIKLFLDIGRPCRVKPLALEIQNVDGGCVWGQQLVAYRLEDQQFLSSG